MSLLIGVDFGTESVRAVLVDGRHGEIVAESARSYTDGVIDVVLPGEGLPLGDDWALQNPLDWLAGLEEVVHTVVHQSRSDVTSIVGLGIDFTSCTMLPVDQRGDPLCIDPELRSIPHSWPKLWKHHAAQPQTDRINRSASESGEPWLARYGGRLSSEWMIPKALQALEEAPDVYRRADRYVEAADWIVWRLTDSGARNGCCAGFKAQWHRREGYPSSAFLAGLHPEFSDFAEVKLRGTVVPPGRAAGTLTPEWSRRLGLTSATVVATPIIDAHAAAIGGGTVHPGDMFMIMGTSTCHMYLSDREVAVEGISGVVEDGIVEGLFGYEAGQASSGDALAWFTAHGVPDAYHVDARAGRSIHDVLSEKAAELEPGQSGLLALDWLNGNRSVLVDADLSGLILGLRLSTRAEHIYRALIEGTAFGTRMIIAAFENAGLPVRNIRVGGSLARNDLLMRIYADVLQRDLLVVESTEVSARGAAVLAGVAAGLFETTAEGAEKIGTRFARTYSPNPSHADAYARLYEEYQRLHDYFGRGENPVMKYLKNQRRI